MWNTLAFTDYSPHPITALADAFGLDTSAAGLRVIEGAIMKRPFRDISQALDVLARATGSEPLDPRTRRELVRVWSAAAKNNQLYPDVLPALQALMSAKPRPRLGLISNTQSFGLEFLRNSGIMSVMDVVCLSHNVGLLKPDPEIFRLAARRMRLPIDRILMVGDRPAADMEGARRAGMKAVLLDRRNRPAADRPDVVSSLRHLPDLVRKSGDLT